MSLFTGNGRRTRCIWVTGHRGLFPDSGPKRLNALRTFNRGTQGLESTNCRGVAIFEAKLLENTGSVNFYRVFCAAKNRRDVAIRLPLGNPEQHFCFARREPKFY